MLLVVVVLLVVSGVASVFAVRAALLLRIERRVDDVLEQEMAELEALLADGRDPATGEPFSSLTRALDVYFDRNVPSAEEAHVALVDGEVYRIDLRSFPVEQLPDEVFDRWRSDGESGGRDSGTFSTTSRCSRRAAA